MKKLERSEMKKLKGGLLEDDRNCHSKTGCSTASNNGNFWGNCPGAPDLPAGCACQNYTCPGS